MSRPVIITCAVTGGNDMAGKHPAIPVTPAEIAAACIGAARAGAAVAHIHVRDPVTKLGCPTLALYREVVERIAASGVDVLVNLTTGEGGMLDLDGSPAERFMMPAPTLLPPIARVAHIEALRPEICTLDMGTANFGDRLFFNTPRDIAGIAEGIRRAGTIAELEVFDLGHLSLALSMLRRNLIPLPAMFQLCLGVRWAAPATPETMLTMRNMLPPWAMWSAFGLGAAQFPMAAQAVLLGGHVRVGLEDNLHLEAGVLAPDNAALVAKAAGIIRALGETVATPAEAREIVQASRGVSLQ